MTLVHCANTMRDSLRKMSLFYVVAALSFEPSVVFFMWAYVGGFYYQKGQTILLLFLLLLRPFYVFEFFFFFFFLHMYIRH